MNKFLIQTDHYDDQWLRELHLFNAAGCDLLYPVRDLTCGMFWDVEETNPKFVYSYNFHWLGHP